VKRKERSFLILLFVSTSWLLPSTLLLFNKHKDFSVSDDTNVENEEEDRDDVEEKVKTDDKEDDLRDVAEDVIGATNAEKDVDDVTTVGDLVEDVFNIEWCVVNESTLEGIGNTFEAEDVVGDVNVEAIFDVEKDVKEVVGGICLKSVF